ncbi:MAG: hypothetical protein Phog2KO_25080 [Phototrophicaceae bacterium]
MHQYLRDFVIATEESLSKSYDIQHIYEEMMKLALSGIMLREWHKLYSIHVKLRQNVTTQGINLR